MAVVVSLLKLQLPGEEFCCLEINFGFLHSALIFARRYEKKSAHPPSSYLL